MAENNDDGTTPEAGTATTNREQAEPTPRARLEFTSDGIFAVPYDGPKPGDIRMKDDEGREDYVTEGPTTGPEPERAVGTGAVTINGKAATSILYDRPDGAAGYALTWKDGRKVVGKMNDVSERELVEALGGVNAGAVQSADGKGRLVGRQLHTHEGTGTEAPARTRSPRTAVATAARDDQGQVAEAEETNRVEPAGPAREPEADADADAETVKVKATPATIPEAPVGDAEQRRREKVLEEVQAQFRVKDGVYRFKDGARAVAFTDRGGRITTASNDARAARAVAAMADGKGWGSIKVSGHAEFKREAWLEASSRGLAVRGYTPTDQDRAELEARAAKQQPNVAERGPEQQPSVPERTAATSTGQGKDESGRASIPASEPSPTTAPAAAKRSGPIAGTLVGHGAAPYKHDPQESSSYHVDVETERGTREVWGVDLERAVTESGAQPGDSVELERTGAEAVTVDANVRDEKGRVVGTEAIAATRRGWDMKVTERRQVIDAVSAEFVRTHAGSDQARERLDAAMRQSIDRRAQAGTLPAVPVYDHRAPSRARGSSAPSRQPGAERTTEHSR